MPTMAQRRSRHGNRRGAAASCLPLGAAALLPLFLLLLVGQPQPALAFQRSPPPCWMAPAAQRSKGARAMVTRMAAADGGGGGLGAGAVAVVLGYQEGTARLLAAKVAEMHQGASVRAILDKAGGGGDAAVDLPGNVQVTYKSLEAVTAGDVAGATVAFVSLDKGLATETGADLGNYVVLPALLAAVPASASVLVTAYANDTASGGQGGALNFFAKGVNPREAVEAARGTGGKRCVLVQHGRLFGASTGAPSPAAATGGAVLLPFVGGPLQKPVVEESYAKQNMLLALGSSLSRNADAATLRATLAEAMARAAGAASSIADFSVVSLEGQAPSGGDWEQQLAGLDTRGGVTVFEKVLAANERVDLAVLQDWLANDFGAGLSTLAISRVLSSPKPAIVASTPVGSDIVWQFIEKDLKVRDSGRWCIKLDTQAGSIKILREDAVGKILTEALPGEEELLQRFSAAINRLVYSKKLSKRR